MVETLIVTVTVPGGLGMEVSSIPWLCVGVEVEWFPKWSQDPGLDCVTYVCVALQKSPISSVL